MADVKAENGMPERIGKLVGDALSALIVIAVIVMMINQFALTPLRPPRSDHAMWEGAWWAVQGLNLRPHPCEGCASL